MNWTYVADGGKRYNVGLFHGDNTGHLLIYCNAKVILIDFNVLNTTDYSFFLDEDLCELAIERKKDSFYYGFKINKDVDTPRNRIRKATEKKHWRQSLVFFGAIIFAAMIFTSFMLLARNRSETPDKAKLLSERGQQTVAKVFIEEEKNDTLLLKFSFIAENRPVQFNRKVLAAQFHKNMPLESGDEFLLSYVDDRPRLHELYLDQPAPSQIRKYRDRTIAKHASLHPGDLKKVIACRIDIAFEQRGLDGLADFYYQDLTPEQNSHHNELTYKRLVRDIPFMEAAEERCF